MKESKDEDWPDEMDFKVERWQRASENENNTSRDQSNPTSSIKIKKSSQIKKKKSIVS